MTLAGSRSVVGGVHIQAFTFFAWESTLKITVGCPRCAYPSIHFFAWENTLKITVGCPRCAYPSIHFFAWENTLKITVACPRCACADSEDHGRLPAVHDCASFVSSSKNSNRTTNRPSPHARSPSMPRRATKIERLGKRPTDQRKKNKGTFCCRNISGEGIF